MTHTLSALDSRIERGWRLGLDGMKDVLSRMDPVKYPVVLVGGTNGKGSVCRRLHDWFRHCGNRTGLTISPHLVDVRERIMVDGVLVSVDEFDELFTEISRLDGDRSTYFETLALMAIRHFQKKKVDIAVVEIGLGGRLDAFNALDPAVSVITSIGFEHEQYLGDTLEKIAMEKAQIARNGRTCILGCDLPALEQEVMRIGARIEIISPSVEETFVERNIETAVAAARAVQTLRGADFDEEECRRVCEASRWPCRFEVISASPEIVLDAAHNPPAAEALARALKKLPPRRKTVALVAFVSDKDIPGFFVRLDEVVDEWIVTEFEGGRAMKASDIAAPFNSSVEPNMENALRRAREAAGPHGRILLTGSLYFLGELLRRNVVDSPSYRTLNPSFRGI